MSAILVKCLGEMKHLETILGRCERWEWRGCLEHWYTVFYKLALTENFCSEEFKIGSKFPQNDGEKLDKGSWSSLEGFFQQIEPSELHGVTFSQT